MSIYSDMVAAGVPIDSHESDLYVPVNETTRAIVDGYQFHASVQTFRHATTGAMWFDIPFAYTPFWEKRCA
jgi:hypothetical protein